MGGIRFYTGLLRIKESKFTVVDNVYFCSLNESRPLKAEKTLMKVMRTDRKTIAEPQNDVEDVMEEGTGLDEAKEAAPKRPIKSVLLPSHKIVNSKKNRNVTFNDLSTKGTTNVKVVKPGETEDLKVDNTNAIEEHNREVEVIRAEIAKTEKK